MPIALSDHEALKAYYLKQLEANGWQSRIAGAANTAKILDALVTLKCKPHLGLLIGGKPGTGKSSLLYALPAICNGKKRFISLGHTGLEVFSFEYQAEMGIDYMECTMFLDDIGAELTKNDYGQLEEPVGRFLTRYEELGQKRIFATTNLTFEEVAERYGARVASRLKTLFLPLHLDGDDRRQWTKPINTTNP